MTNATVRLQRDGDVAVITIDNPPVNALSWPVRVGLMEAFDAVQHDASVRAVVLTCAGKTFSAGADLAELRAAPRAPSMGAVMQHIEASRAIIVAAIHGQALGGGLETALLADYRIADAASRCGLPEIDLGLMPGGGATQRLPRLIGVRPALEMMLSGKKITAADGLALGLVDRVAEGDVVAAALAFVHSEDCAVHTQRRPGLRPPPSAEGIDFAALRTAALKSARGVPAAGYCVDAVDASTQHDLAEGLAIEAALFQRARQSSESLALRHLFAAERAVAKVPGLEQTAARAVEHVVVVGAGTMGIGVSIALLDAGCTVSVVDAAPAALDRLTETVEKTYAGLLARGRIDAVQRDERLGRLCRSATLDSAAEADLAIECVFEALDVKRAVFAQLGALMRPDAVLATNTSALDVNQIAQASGRAGNVVGMHFFSPANIMRLVEVVRAAETAPDVLATALALARRMNKIGVVCGVCDGFIGNRLIGGYLREAGLLLLEGAAPEQIDGALKRFGMAMGPHAMGDLAGLDIQAAARSRRRAEGKLGNDPRIGAVGDALVAAGRLGLKSGRGIYAYRDGSREPVPDAEVAELIAAEARRLGVRQRSFDDREIAMRCLLPIVNEGARVLEEGIALGAADIDVVYANGYGFPRMKGGPMFWADSIGLGEVLAQIERFAERDPGPAWQPAQLLVELAHGNRSFGDLKRGELSRPDVLLAATCP